MSPRVTHPTVANRPISSSRRDVFEDEVRRAHLASVSRKMAQRTPLSEVPSLRTADFVTLGYNSILDRIPFVEGVFGGVEYAVQGMGYPFGEGLAEGETRYILDRLHANTDVEMVGGQSDSFSYELIQQGISRLNTEERVPTVILTNIADHLKLWSRPFPRLADGNPGIPGHYTIDRLDIPIVFTRLLSEGTSLVVDQRAGQLTMRQDLTIEFFDRFTEVERAQLLDRHPDLTAAELNEKIRVLIQESVRFDVVAPTGYIWLRSSVESESPSQLQRQTTA